MESKIAMFKPVSEPLKQRQPARRSPVGQRFAQIPSQVQASNQSAGALMEEERQMAETASTEDFARMMSATAANMK